MRINRYAVAFSIFLATACRQEVNLGSNSQSAELNNYDEAEEFDIAICVDLNAPEGSSEFEDEYEVLDEINSYYARGQLFDLEECAPQAEIVSQVLESEDTTALGLVDPRAAARNIRDSKRRYQVFKNVRNASKLATSPALDAARASKKFRVAPFRRHLKNFEIKNYAEGAGNPEEVATELKKWHTKISTELVPKFEKVGNNKPMLDAATKEAGNLRKFANEFTGDQLFSIRNKTGKNEIEAIAQVLPANAGACMTVLNLLTNPKNLVLSDGKRVGGNRAVSGAASTLLKQIAVSFKGKTKPCIKLTASVDAVNAYGKMGFKSVNKNSMGTEMILEGDAFANFAK